MNFFMELGVRGRSHRLMTILGVVALVAATAAGSTQAANGSVTYTYDALGRLVTANYDTGVCIIYTYDANGNRTSEKILVVSGTSTGVWGCFTWNGANWGT